MAKRKISKPLSITTEAIAEALKTTDGGVYLAAERLRCNPGTIYDRIKADPTLAELKNNLRGKLVDIAETSLKRGVLAGEGWAVCFTLKTIGKDRGYVERSEITGKDGGPVQTEEKVLSDPERLERLAALYDRVRTRTARRPQRRGAAKKPNPP